MRLWWIVFFIIFKKLIILFYNCREKIPLVMQDECDEIYPAVLINILHGRNADMQMHYVHSPFLGKFYGPHIQVNRSELF